MTGREYLAPEFPWIQEKLSFSELHRNAKLLFSLFMITTLSHVGYGVAVTV